MYYNRKQRRKGTLWKRFKSVFVENGEMWVNCLAYVERFLVKASYLTDSGMIGSKAFVFELYLKFQDIFQNPGKHRPSSVHGLSGVHSLKQRLEFVLPRRILTDLKGLVFKS